VKQAANAATPPVKFTCPSGTLIPGNLCGTCPPGFTIFGTFCFPEPKTPVPPRTVPAIATCPPGKVLKNGLCYA
jgi:hypothetical protein